MEPNKTLTNLAGSEELLVSHENGRQERVRVLCLHIKKFPSLMKAMGDECAQADLFCDKPPGWAETLLNSSVIEIYELGHKLNDDFFIPWGQRRIREQEKLVPGITSAIGARLTSGSQSSQSAQASASPKP